MLWKDKKKNKTFGKLFSDESVHVCSISFKQNTWFTALLYGQVYIVVYLLIQ